VPTARVAILIGLQASGKTTFYRKVLAPSFAHVSKDNFPNARQKQLRQERLLAEALSAGQSVAVDNTNPSRAERAAIIAVARTYSATVIGYWFPPDVEVSLTRNAAREKPVPEVGLFATLARLDRPTPAEFDEFYTVVAANGTFTVTRTT
jgi:predicted kinase